MSSYRFDRIIERLQALGRKPKIRGDKATSLAPCHDDKKPSFGVTRDPDGSASLKCFAGCNFKAIVAALGLRAGDRIGRPSTSHAEGQPSPEKSAQKPNVYRQARLAEQSILKRLGADWSLAANYSYESTDRKCLMRMLRFERPRAGSKPEKTFRPIHPVEGGWIVGDPPGLLPLYRLPKLLSAPASASVVVVEGEKTANALVDIEIDPVTTWSHGAGDVERTDWSWCAGKHAVFLPDNDAPSREAGAKLASILARLDPPATLHILELPDLVNEKDDAVEFIATRRMQGKSTAAIRQEILDLAAAAPAVGSESPDDEACTSDGRDPDDEPEPRSNASNTTTAPKASSQQSRTPAWPSLDPKVWYGLARDFVLLVAPHTDADPAALYFSFLAAFGVVVGPRLHFTVGATRHALNIFILLIGATARARKGTALAWVEALFKLAIPDWPKLVLSGLVSGEGLIESIRDPLTQDRPIKDDSGRVTEYQEVTVDKGVSDKRILVVETEFARVLAACAREGNTLGPIIRDLFDGRLLRSLARKNNNLRATEPHGGILAHCTDDELRSIVRPEDIHGGTINRFLIVCARRTRKLAIPTRPSADEWTALANRVRTAIDWARQQSSTNSREEPARAAELTFDSDAEALWCASYDSLTGDASGKYGAATARSDALAWRLAAVFAATDRSLKIRRHHVRAALEAWAYCDASARILFPEGHRIESEDDRRRGRLIAWIGTQPERQTTARQLARNGPKELRAAGAAEAALQELVNLNLASWFNVDRSRACRLCDAGDGRQIAGIAVVDKQASPVEASQEAPAARSESINRASNGHTATDGPNQTGFQLISDDDRAANYLKH